MDISQTDLLQDFSLVTKSFEQLGQRLSEVAEQVRTAGTLPSESLIEEIATSRRNFTDLRARAIELVGLLSESPKAAPEEIGSMKELEALLQLAAEAQRKRAQQEKARTRALTVLDRLLSLVHRDHPDFAPLSECQAKSRALREAIHDHTGAELHPDVTALAQGRLLSQVVETLGPATWIALVRQLESSVSQLITSVNAAQETPESHQTSRMSCSRQYCTMSQTIRK